MAGIGNLVAFLSVNSKKWNRGFAKASAAANKFTSNYKRSSGKIKKSNDNLTKQFAAIRNQMLTTFGGLALISGIGATIKKFVEFEKAGSQLKAISKATGEEMGKLSKAAKKLGASTAFTATEVTNLQTEFARLGFSTREILNATEATLALAAATGTELPQAAKQTGAAIRAFGLDASEAARVADVFAEAAASSALNMEFLDTAMSKVAPVAKTFGFSIEESTALLGSLADAGFDASVAATSTRSILLNLADSNGALAKALGKPIKSMKDLVPALKELRAKGVNLNDTLKLTDKRSVAAFSRFLDGAESLETLTDKLEDAEGAAQRMADTMLDNVAGDITKAQSAWEGMILSIEDGEGIISKAIRGITQGFTSWLQSVTKINEAPLEDTFGKWGGALIKLTGTFNTTFGPVAEKMADVTTRAKALGIGIGKISNAALRLSDAAGVSMTVALEAVLVKFEKQKKALKDNKKGLDDNTNSTENLTENTFALAKAAEKAAKKAKKLADKLAAIAKKEAEAFIDAMLKAQKEVKELFSFLDEPVHEIKISSQLDTPTKDMLKLFKDKDITVRFTSEGVEEGVQEATDTWWQENRQQVISAFSNLFGQLPAAPGQAVSAAEAGLTAAQVGGTEAQIAAAQATLDAAQMAAEEAGQLAQQSGEAFSTAMSFATGDVAGGIQGLVSIFGDGSEAFQRVITKVNDVIGKVVEKLAPIFDALIQAIEPILDAALSLLMPLVDLFIAIMEPIMPLLQMLGELIGALIAPLAPLVEIITSILLPVFKVLGVVLKVVGAILAVIANVFIVIANIFIGIANAFKKKENKIEKLPTVSIPALADGGIVDSPTLALVGERGPEAVVPLDRAGGMMGGKVTFEIMGDRLVGVLDNSNTLKGVTG